MGLRNILRRALRDRGIQVPDRYLKDDEPYMRRVARTLTRDDVVIDLGAHLGIASIEFSHYAGEIHAFEPHPDIFPRLRRNVRNYPRITPVNRAVSPEGGPMMLFFETHADGRPFEGSSLVQEKDNLSYDNGVVVQTVKLSDYVAGLAKPVAVIKVDVEGAEYRVLGELIETPAMARVGKVFVECHVGRVPGLDAERAAFEKRIAELGIADRFDFTWP